MFSDNGGEFESSEFKDMCENFNIKVVTTPAEAPWSNGICEWHNHILTETPLKIKEDVNCNWETALAWAINAKISLININGFSPYQLVFGGNVSLPSVFSDKVPALEGLQESPAVTEHLAALHTALKTFVLAESSEKIRRALPGQMMKTRDMYSTGQEVCYKRKDQPRWKAPGKIIGQDGTVAFIRHEGQYVKAHSCRVQPLEECTFVSSREEKNMETNEETKKVKIYEAPRVKQKSM